MNFSYKQLEDFSREIFKAIGTSPENAQIAARTLVSADLRGVDSHGVARLSGYVRLWEAARINSEPEMKITRETPSTATIDADRALGLISGPYAMEIAIRKAREVGTGWVVVNNSNHFGIAGFHSMMALEEDMIGWAMTNASPLVAPTFSSERLLGTNPISVAIPAGKEPPFVADFATTTVANGKLEILQRTGESAPYGWAQDKDGKSTTDPFAVKEGGALLPLGGKRENGSHKGYCLGSIVDIFSGVLSGAGYGPWAPPFVSYLPLPSDPQGQGLGHFFGAMRVDAFRPLQEYQEHMDNWLRRFRQSKPSPGNDQVYVPGDPEREEEEKRKQEGIAVNQKVYVDLLELGQRFNVEL